MKKNLSEIKLPATLLARCQELANEVGKSLDYIIITALEKYLDENESKHLE